MGIYCDFCKEPKIDDVKKFYIENNYKAICCDCIAECNKVIAENKDWIDSLIKKPVQKIREITNATN